MGRLSLRHENVGFEHAPFGDPLNGTGRKLHVVFVGSISVVSKNEACSFGHVWFSR